MCRLGERNNKVYIVTSKLYVKFKTRQYLLLSQLPLSSQCEKRAQDGDHTEPYQAIWRKNRI